MYRLGIDVGGTNTDAVVMKGQQVLAGIKTATTLDVTSGVRTAMLEAIAAAGVSSADIKHVMIGTTHFTNAIIERRHLSEVAAIRLGLPATACLPPMVDWPDELRNAVGGHCYLLKGGYEFDGRKIAELDHEGLINIAQELKSQNIKYAAISCVFGPINAEMETEAKEILLTHYPDLRIVLSTTIGRIGLLERESASIMNACLLHLAEKTIDAFTQAIADCGLNCPFYITQNDGTLMSADMVKQFPVLTFASGPTNSMRGAAFLTGIKEAIVVDIGGTTADIGALSQGFPRQASTVVDIGGVRTNFRMPDVLSIGLGGGSIVIDEGEKVKIGPQSVGYRIASEAKVFGGNTLTTSDIMVKLGRVNIGDATRLSDVDEALATRAANEIAQMLERAVERCRTSPEPIPVIAVGGGSILMPEKFANLEIIKPENFAVANAVGAAIAQISGEVDRIFSLENGQTREHCLLQAEQEARQMAIAAGALENTIEIIEREDVPLAYLPGNATRIRVRVVGEMAGLHE